MASYYSQVEEAIKKNQKELAHLQDELRGLRTVEKDTPRESYQRQHAQILYHIDLEQRQLEKNRNLLQDYEEAHRAITELRASRENTEIEELRSLLATERDPHIRREISEEIDAKTKEHESRIESLETRVQTSMGRLTDELAEELRNSFLIEETEDNKEASLEEGAPEIHPSEEAAKEEVVREETLDEREKKFAEELEKAETVYGNAEADYKTSIEKLQAIFEEERTIRENDGPFATEEELDNFTSEYMRRKIEENERLEAARDKMARAQKKIASIERKMATYAELKEEARREQVDVVTYEKIKKTVASKEVLDAVYETKGLGEVSRRSKKGKETANEVSQEVVRRVIEQLRADGIISGQNVSQQGLINQNGAVNIIDTINIIYGTDIPVKAGESRTITITSEEKERVKTTQKVKVKVRKVPHNGNEQEGKTPGKAPTDMEGAKVTVTETTQEDNKVSTEETKTEERPVEAETTSEKEVKEESKTNTENETSSETGTETGTTETENPVSDDQKGVKEFNPDGTYRLRKDQIIQDDLGKRPEPKKPEVPVQPVSTDGQDKPGTGMVPYEPKPTGMVPYKPPVTDLVPVGTKEPTKVQVHEPVQVLYGPPPVQKPIEVKVTEKPTEKPVDPIKPTEKPQPTKEPVKPTEAPKKETPKRGLITILDEITDGLDLKAKDGKRYKASNIKCFKGFKEELKSGNYLYNIVHLVPAIVKLPFSLIRKASGKIMLRAESKKNIKTLKERISKLSEEDLMTIYKEYRGSRVIQEGFPSILNTLLEERIQQFAMSKVSQINSELEQRYAKAFASIRELEGLERLIHDPKTSAEDKKKYEQAKKDLLKGQAQNIAAIRKGYIAANEWMSGGSHGFSEDMKAATTKLSVVGKRFAKDHDLDRELLHRQAQLEQAEMRAIADGNDEMALRTFIQAETLLSQNTEISGSVFGRRSTGKKYYSPLAEQLDYRDDPFVRDLFTTIAVTSAAISTVQSIRAAKEQADIMAENQRIMDRNNQTMDQVNQMGADIAGKRGTMMEGMEAQGMEDTLAGANEIERAVLDKTDWGLGTKAYRTADNAGHAYYTSFYDGTKAAYENIAQQYAAGQINQAQAMQMMADLTTKTHQTFGNINDACLDILRPYAQTHPQFDLTGVQGAMEYLQANPDAFQAMNQAMVDVTNAGDVLASMQLEQLIPLTTLPSTIRTTIINGAATAALASNINNTMGAKKHTYGNEVTEMVEEYAEEQAERRAEREEVNSRGNSK